MNEREFTERELLDFQANRTWGKLKLELADKIDTCRDLLERAKDGEILKSQTEIAIYREVMALPEDILNDILSEGVVEP